MGNKGRKEEKGLYPITGRFLVKKHFAVQRKFQLQDFGGNLKKTEVVINTNTHRIRSYICMR